MRTTCLLVLLIPAVALAGQPAAPTIDALVGHLISSTDPVVRVTAAAAIVELGPAALPAFDALVRSAGAVGGPEGRRASPLNEDLARPVRLAIEISERLKKQPQSEVGFWMNLEDALAIEPQPVRDAALRRALGHDGVVADVLARRAAGRQVAIEFCRKWTDNGGVVAPAPSPQVVASNKKQEAALAAAGPTAAPYLLWVPEVEARRGSSSPRRAGCRSRQPGRRQHRLRARRLLRGRRGGVAKAHRQRGDTSRV